MAKNKKAIKELPEIEVLGQRAWDFQIVRSYKKMLFWQILAICSFLAFLFETMIMTYYIAEPKYIPYVVQIDSEGGIDFSGILRNKKITVDDNMMRSYIINFVTKTRQISIDTIILKQNLLDAYYLLSQTGQVQLTNQIQEESPFELSAAGSRRDIKFITFERISENAWRSEWDELTRQDGKLTERTRKVGTFSYIQAFVDDEIAAEKNPLGIYFTEYFISNIRK